MAETRDSTLYVAGWATPRDGVRLWHFYRKVGVGYTSLCGFHQRSGCGALRREPGAGPGVCVKCKMIAQKEGLQARPYRR